MCVSQEMMDEYLRALRLPGTPVRTFRLRAVLLRAMEQDLTFEELADGEAFFTYSEYVFTQNIPTISAVCSIWFYISAHASFLLE